MNMKKKHHNKLIERVLKIKTHRETDRMSTICIKTYLFHACLRFLELYRVKRSEIKKRNNKQSLFQMYILQVC